MKFWKERWMGNNALYDLYALAMMPAIRIPLAENEERNACNLTFRRYLQRLGV